MVEEEERLDGLGIVNPRSEYLDPSTPALPPSMLTLSTIYAIIGLFVFCIMYAMALYGSDVKDLKMKEVACLPRREHVIVCPHNSLQ